MVEPRFRIYQDDVVKWAISRAWLADNCPQERFHALLTDPPYHLTSIVKRYGRKNSAPNKFGTDGAYQRQSAGFMGQEWDGGDIAFQPDTWYWLAKMLHPGGFIMAFASSRNYHHMAMAMENAGLILHPSIFAWTYRSGFPKATRIDSQLRKTRRGGNFDCLSNEAMTEMSLPERLACWQAEQDFEGHRYGGQAMKPAVEPIIVAQRPYEGRPVDCISGSGAGALNIDNGRVGNGEDRANGGPSGVNAMWGSDKPRVERFTGGRWPANFVLQHLPDCQDGDQCADGCPVQLLDLQSGDLKAGGDKTGNEPSDMTDLVYGGGYVRQPYKGYADSGGASRMFFNGHWAYEIYERLADSDSVFYAPKASVAEREAGLDSLPAMERRRTNRGGYERDPKWSPRQRKNPHPTVKPTSLTQFLAGLLLPPERYAPRRILVPFSGVASEVIGAMLAGWDEVVGIEQGAEYAAIANHRAGFWLDMMQRGHADPQAIVEAAKIEQEKREPVNGYVQRSLLEADSEGAYRG